MVGRGSLSLVSSLGLLLLLGSPASATLLRVDLLAPGDGLITRDTTTGLDWLDATATLNLSWDDVRADAGGWISRGFRHATFDEVCDLFSREGFGGQDCRTAPDTTDPTILANVTRLITEIGRTGGGGPADAQNNLDAIYDQNGAPEGGGLRTTPRDDPTEARIRMSNRFPGTADRDSAVGHYLVVAEPSAIWLLLGAGALLLRRASGPR